MAEVEVEVKDAPAEKEPEAAKADEPETVEAPAEPPQEEQTMKAVILSGHGGYSKLKIEKRPKPEAAEGHVLIKVHACGQNFFDLMQRQGMIPKLPKPPSVLGIECSGVVEEVGENVTGLEVGSRVCCISFTGAFAEFVSVPAKFCYAMPDSMSFEDGAAFPINYLTAYFLLFHCGNISRRKNVLIHCAAGGVGMAATQLCKTVEGVTVFGTASASKHEVITKNGVDHAIDYRTEDYVEAVKKVTESIDLVLDPLGGGETKKSYDLLSPLGALVIHGYASHIAESKGFFAGFKSWFAGLTFSPLKLLSESKMVSGFALEEVKPELLKDAMDVLMKLYQDGAVKPHIDTVFAMEEVANAHQKMHDRANIGKILLSPLKEPAPDTEPVRKRKRSFSKFHAEKPKIAKDKSAEAEKPKEDSQEENKEQPEPEEGPTEAAVAETKEGAQEEDKPKEEAKEENKEEAKEEVKEATKEEVKEETKEDATEEKKEEDKEQAKEEVQEEKEVQEKPKEEAKEDTPEKVKGETNEDTTEETKEEVKEQEEPSKGRKEETKGEEIEEAKVESKEENNEVATEEKKEEVQEEPKEEQKEESKETPEKQPTETEQQQPETKAENGEQTTEM